MEFIWSIHILYIYHEKHESDALLGKEHSWEPKALIYCLNFLCLWQYTTRFLNSKSDPDKNVT